MRENGRPDVFASAPAGAMALRQPASNGAFKSQRAALASKANSRARVEEAVGEQVVDQVVVRLMSLDMLLTVLLQRVYIPLSITLATHLLVAGVLLIRGRLRISATRLCLYLLFWGVATAVQFFSGNTFSPESLLLGIVSYISFLGVVPAARETYIAFLRNFQKIAMMVAALVFMDIALQLAGLGMPTMDAILPAGMAPPGMNYIQPTMFKASLLKPNAFFMMEASYTSQFVALGLIFEISLFRRWRWLVAYALALLLTFSGTGLMLVLVCLPILTWRFWRQMLVPALVLLPLLGGIAVATGWYEIAARRAETFDVKNSSANERFVAPFTTIYDVAASGDLHNILFGFGSGKTAVQNIVPGISFDQFNPVSKVFLEYGFFVTVLFMIFATYITFSTGTLFICAYAAYMEYHFMGGYFLLPNIVNYLYLLAAGWEIRPDEQPIRRPSHF
jgi:hypothetical protein